MTPERPAGRGRYDVVIVGAGPAGLAAASTCAQCGLSYVVLERERVASTVHAYPLRKPLHSPPQDVELAWGEVHTHGHRNPTREEVLAHYDDFAATHLEVRAPEEVRSLARVPGGIIEVLTGQARYEAKSVILATGGFGVPRRLDVPGEHAACVSYRFVEGAPYAGQDVLVVGGGNSAAEAALFLHEAGARVTLSLRRPTFAPRGGVEDLFTSVKTFNSGKLEALAARGELRILYRSSVRELTPGAAVLRVDGEPLARTIACEHVFALVGADPDVTLLRQIGARLAADGRPVYDPDTYETSIRGLYVAGHLTREPHMPNALAITPRIVRRIAGEAPSSRGAAPLPDFIAFAAKKLRRKSEFARRLIRAHAALRRLVQAVDAANTLRVRYAVARRLVRRHPRLRVVVQSFRRAFT
jgi:bacillithiol disulfide reductase